MGIADNEENNTNKSYDGFYYRDKGKISGFSPNWVGMEEIYGKCISQCIQNGKPCPIYDTCIQRK